MEFDTSSFTDLVISYGIKILLAAATLVIGLYIAKFITALIGKSFKKSKLSPALETFLLSLIGSLLKAMVYITALGMLGVEMTSFVVMLGAIGFAIGMALSGTLQNFAGSVMILLFKPYKVGDVIEAQGFIGSVNEIQIFVTVLTTPDNKTILIPNGPMANGALTNFSTQPTRRVDFTFGIAYGDDVDTAYAVLDKLIAADSRIINEPAPFRAVAELADSSVNIVVRVWVEAADYWGVFFTMNEAVYKSFDKAGLSIPFPQTDVHIHQAN